MNEFIKILIGVLIFLFANAFIKVLASEKCYEPDGTLIYTDACIYQHMNKNFESLDPQDKKIACDLDTRDYTGFNHSEKCKQYRQERKQ